MQDIRSSKARQSLRRTNSQRPICSAFQESSRTQLLPGQPPPSAKKVIQPDEQFSNEIFNFEGDDPSPNSSQVSEKYLSNIYETCVVICYFFIALKEFTICSMI